MAEKLTALAGRVGPPLALALASALLATALVAAWGIAVSSFGRPASTRAATSETTSTAAAFASTEQCYAWDVVNATGEEADGLSIRLMGVQTITNVYVGEANPFGVPRPGSGYDAADGSYEFDLGMNAVTAAAGESVRVGVCTPNAVASAHMQWLAGATALGAGVNPLAVTWRWPSLDEMQVEVKNTTGTTVTILGVSVLSPETKLTVDDLDTAVAMNLDTAAEVEEPALLAPGGVLSSLLPLLAGGPGHGEPVLLSVEWAEGDDLSDTATVYVAASVPAEIQMFLPAISR